MLDSRNNVATERGFRDWQGTVLWNSTGYSSWSLIRTYLIDKLGAQLQMFKNTEGSSLKL